ncbi:MAG: hypothetical protein K0R00_160 [Herbinix sp.]|jgi:hypothetical protein|nr:hypothetical protein [Herbinix sp.]
MMKEVTLTGLYKGKDSKGTIIGGKTFTPNNVATTDVTEDVFLKLEKAQSNGWFQIIKHNYQQFLEANGRKVVIPAPAVVLTEVAEVPVAEVPVTEVPVTEVPVAEVPVAEVPEVEVPVTEVPEVEVPVTEVPEVEVPQILKDDEDIVTELDKFIAMGTRAQNAAIKSLSVSREILNHVIKNEADFKETTVELAKSIIM